MRFTRQNVLNWATTSARAEADPLCVEVAGGHRPPNGKVGCWAALYTGGGGPGAGKGGRGRRRALHTNSRCVDTFISATSETNLLAGKQQRLAVMTSVQGHTVVFRNHRTFLPSVVCLTTQISRERPQMSRVYTAHCHKSQRKRHWWKAERGYIHSSCRKTQKKEAGLTQASFFLVCEKKENSVLSLAYRVSQNPRPAAWG